MKNHNKLKTELKRKKRLEMTVSLRKKNRESLIKKKRFGDSNLNVTDYNFDEIINLIKHNDNHYYNLDYIRKFISCGDIFINIDLIIINSIVLDYIFDILKNSKDFKLINEVLYIVINITSVNDNKCFNNKLLPILISLMDSDNINISNMSIYALNNILVDSIEYRNFSVENNIYDKILLCLKKNYDDIDIYRNTSQLLLQIIVDSNFNWSIYYDLIIILFNLYKLDDSDIKLHSIRGIAHITKGNKRNLEIVINSGILKDLLQYLDSKDNYLIKSILNLIGNLSSEDIHMIQYLFDLNIIPILKILLDNESSDIKMKVCWILSNIVNGTNDQLNNLIENGIIKDILQKSGNLDIKREISWILFNISERKDIIYIDYLINNNSIDKFLDLIDSMDTEIIYLIVKSIDNFIDFNSDRKKFINLIESVGIIDKIELLQQSYNNEEIIQLSRKIMANIE